MSGKAVILQALDGCSLDVAQIADSTGLRRKTVSEYMLHLRAEAPRRIRIIGWRTAQRPIYTAGTGPDALQPAPLTKRQRNRRNYRVIKADPVKRLEKTMRDRAYKARMRRPGVPVQSWLSALLA